MTMFITTIDMAPWHSLDKQIHRRNNLYLCSTFFFSAHYGLFGGATCYMCVWNGGRTELTASVHYLHRVLKGTFLRRLSFSCAWSRLNVNCSEAMSYKNVCKTTKCNDAILIPQIAVIRLGHPQSNFRPLQYGVFQKGQSGN